MEVCRVHLSLSPKEPHIQIHSTLVQGSFSHDSGVPGRKATKSLRSPEEMLDLF